MARYRVLQTSFINFVRVEPDAEVDYDGKPDANLEPLDDEARAAFAARLAEVAAIRKEQDARKAALVAAQQNVMDLI